MLKGDRVVIFGYFVLVFFSGMVFGFIFNVEGAITFVAWINSAANLATVAAAITAVVALRSWYLQFQHTEKYKLIREFQLILNDRNAIRDYIYACKDHLLMFIAAETSGETSPIDLTPRESTAAWRKHCDALQQAWGNMTLMLSEDELSLLTHTPSSLEAEIFELVGELMDEAFEDSDLRRKYKVVRASATGAEKMAGKYLELEEDTRRLLKKITM